MNSKKNVLQPQPTASTLPETGFVRLRQIIGDSKASPPIPALFPVCRSTWFDGVRTGRFPAGIRLSPRVMVWRVEDIRALIASPLPEMAP